MVTHGQEVTQDLASGSSGRTGRQRTVMRKGGDSDGGAGAADKAGAAKETDADADEEADKEARKSSTLFWSIAVKSESLISVLYC